MSASISEIGIQPLLEASPPAMCAIWTDAARVLLHRSIWLAVYDFHVTHGVVDNDPEVRRALERAFFDVDMDSIYERERVTRHDLKASLDEYLHIAGVPEVLHLGMTSADVVENVTQIQMAQSMQLLMVYVPVPDLMASGLHNWPNWFPMRGIKGAVGTQQDQVDLLGNGELAEALDRWVATTFGFKHTFGSVGQVYPRSLDFDVVCRLQQVTQYRPWSHLLAGYQTMVMGYMSDQWNEGDVSSSVVRRVALPQAFLSAAASVIGGHLQQLDEQNLDVQAAIDELADPPQSLSQLLAAVSSGSYLLNQKESEQA